MRQSWLESSVLELPGTSGELLIFTLSGADALIFCRKWVAWTLVTALSIPFISLASRLKESQKAHERA